MVPIFRNVTDTLKAKIPNVPILPSIGNNDVMWHYQAPNSTYKAEYYSDLYEIFFENVPANSAYPKLNEISDTFHNGGYYRYEITEDLIFLSINSIYFNSENEVDFAEAAVEMDWIAN